MMIKQTPKHKWSTLFTILLIMCVLAGMASAQMEQANAYGLRSDSPQRKAIINVSFTTYEWWLLTWSNSQFICKVFVEHEGWPEPEEIDYFCGKQVMDDWLATSPCSFSEEITEAAHCPGLYLHLANVTPGEREIEVDLLPPEVFVNFTNCDPQPPENRCNTLPNLHLIGEEPLPNETIINIQGFIGEEAFTCKGNDCSIPLPATSVDGIEVSFWAESSFGDSSETFTAQVRVIPWGDFVAPDVQSVDEQKWYVDILSSQYLGNIDSTCAQIWSSFPPVGGPSPWLTSPEHPDGLITNTPFYYLAGSLISQGVIDVGGCPDGGLQSPGIANQCGLEASRDVIEHWQNQFNSEIINVANETGIPAQLMKNIFSRESQFWPGYSVNHNEAGLGHLTDLGADTVLLWNPSFFSQFCPLVLNTETCQRGFGNLDIAEQEMLRGALFQKVNAACTDCPQGIDLRQANFSISIFARSLLANCEQVGQILYNETQQLSGKVSNYEDLWRFTLVNYNAGPGCLSDAIHRTNDSNYPLTWENVSNFLEPGACEASIKYVEDISTMAKTPGTEEKPTPSPTPPPTSTPETPEQPTPTPTEFGYPTIPDPTQQEAYP